MCTVSVCVPCHNAGPYVGAAIESVLNQTWKDLEIIVVDDGSTDESAQILKSYSGRIRIITEACGNASKARNRAFAEATGDYIKFFDADDLLSPDFIERQMERLSRRTDAVASSEWGRFYDDDLFTFQLNPESVWRDMKASDWLVEAWRSARPMMQPGIFLIPRPIIESVGGWNEELTLIDDFEFFARILCGSSEVLFTPGAVLYYRSGIRGSLSSRKSRRAIESAFHSLIGGTEQLLRQRDDSHARSSCANVLQDFIYTYFPAHPDLRDEMRRRVSQLGESDLTPDGPPRFQTLRKFIGWKLARRVQLFLR